jgi:hypothetical protein
MNTFINSELFEKAARREVTPEDAASALIARDVLARKERVAAARPTWVPGPLWAIATVVIVVVIDSLRRN